MFRADRSSFRSASSRQKEVEQFDSQTEMAAGLENEVSALKLQLQKEVSEKLVFKNRCESIEGEARLNQNRFDEQMVRLKNK